jgi:hypothetical protein
LAGKIVTREERADDQSASRQQNAPPQPHHDGGGGPVMNSVWFARFADIPGINYQTPADIDLQLLAGRNTRPKEDRYNGGGYLMWPTADGSTSRSPAGERAFGETKGLTTAKVLTHVAEALELPGEPSDYHVALQRAAIGLYSRRRSEPVAIEEAQRLFLLDLQLLQARPEIARSEYDKQEQYLHIVGLARLLRMYLTEGRVADAAAIADIAERFGAGAMPDVTAARARAAAVAAEDAT